MRYRSRVELMRRKSIHSDIPQDAKRRTLRMLTTSFFVWNDSAIFRPSKAWSRVPCSVRKPTPPNVDFSDANLSNVRAWGSALVTGGAVDMRDLVVLPLTTRVTAGVQAMHRR